MREINPATYTGLIVGATAVLFAIGMVFFPEKINIIQEKNMQYLFAALAFIYGAFRVYRSVRELRAK